MKDAAHDFSPTAIQARAVQLKELQSRLRTISPSAWPVDQKVDWVLVRIELNDLDFRYRVIRPWSRDPSFYLDFFRTMPYADVAVPASKLNNFRIQLLFRDWCSKRKRISRKQEETSPISRSST